MRSLEVQLPNGFDGDSLVHVVFRHSRRGLLFDAGDPSRLARRDVLRLDHVLVSHCHVDHFIGFDALVRPRVCRADRLTVHGPPGFLDRVEARLSGYTWNLVDGNHCVVVAREVLPERVRVASFDSGRAFRREDGGDEPRDPAGPCHVGADFTIEARALDHHVVSMGWALQLADDLSVRESSLAESGLAPGPWVGELKDALARGAEDTVIDLPDGARGNARDLGRDLVERTPGERVAYVTDTACNETTRDQIIALARGADLLACGAPFIDAERDRAAVTRHLTAAQAGELAREAGARALLLFHVSDRHGGDPSKHLEEARRAAGPDIEVTTRDPSPRAER